MPSPCASMRGRFALQRADSSATLAHSSPGFALEQRSRSRRPGVGLDVERCRRLGLCRAGTLALNAAAQHHLLATHRIEVPRAHLSARAGLIRVRKAEYGKHAAGAGPVEVEVRVQFETQTYENKNKLALLHASRAKASRATGDSCSTHSTHPPARALHTGDVRGAVSPRMPSGRPPANSLTAPPPLDADSIKCSVDSPPFAASQSAPCPHRRPPSSPVGSAVLALSAPRSSLHRRSVRAPSAVLSAPLSARCLATQTPCACTPSHISCPRLRPASECALLRHTTL